MELRGRILDLCPPRDNLSIVQGQEGVGGFLACKRRRTGGQGVWPGRLLAWWEELFVAWFSQMWAAGGLLNGRLLRENALQGAEQLGTQTF